MIAFRLFATPLLRHPGRALLSLLAIALGVALGVGVDAIHRSALDEFARGVRQLAGSADAQVAGPRDGFAESIYAQIARHPDVAWAAPVVEVEARLAGRAGANAGRDNTSDSSLRLLGIDPLRAWRVNPALLPLPREGGAGSDDRLGLLNDDTLALTPAAAQALGVGIGDTLRFVAGSEVVELTVIGLLPGVGGGQQLAVADIATVQARFHRLGRLSRIDLVLAPPRPAAAALAAIGALLPAGVQVATVAASEARAERLSRAYRVNLALLALIALVTGAFLVFSTQAASIVRRRAELAFLRALGLSRRELVAGLLLEAAALGIVGSLLGGALGLGFAAGALALLGGDLGAGYFSGATPQLTIAPPALAGQMLLGVAAALAGAWLPAREAAATPPALALKAGDDERALAGLDRSAPGLLCLAAGVLCLLLPSLAGLPAGGGVATPDGLAAVLAVFHAVLDGLPAVLDGLPTGAYAAIGFWLAGAVLLLPRLARLVFARLPAGRDPARRLAVAQLRGAPGMASLGIAGIVAATAVATAMAIMVGSFRDSVDRWLTAVLPAELYVRVSRGGETGFLDARWQATLAGLAGVSRVDPIRHGNFLLDAKQPPVALIARPLPGTPAALIGAVAAPPSDAQLANLPRLWASEAMADLYGWQLGQRVELPLDGRRRAFLVGGFWRDYARSFGAVIVDLADYRRLTGDPLANDAALFLAAGVAPTAIVDRLRGLPGGDLLEIVDNGEIRRKSLAVFDRTFAVTYALEAAAVLIGLAGVAASFAALAAGRLREFGMLAHLGLSRRELARLVASEGAAGAGLGIVVGLVLGLAIALVLIHVVNRQSFHWSMDLAVPWLSLAAFALAMLLGATLAALLAARPAFGRRAVMAVREDW